MGASPFPSNYHSPGNLHNLKRLCALIPVPKPPPSTPIPPSSTRLSAFRNFGESGRDRTRLRGQILIERKEDYRARNERSSGETHLSDVLWDLHRKSGRRRDSVPAFTAPTHLKGTAGLDTLDRLLLSTLSCFPKNRFWAEQRLNPMDFRETCGIGIWPKEVTQALARARLTERGWKGETLTEDPESLVAAGGPLIRCLRLLAVAGAGSF
ncbi:hypothetical protein HQ520_16480 [bacterium]|nr:hypothetical protein [bacterium]